MLGNIIYWAQNASNTRFITARIFVKDIGGTKEPLNDENNRIFRNTTNARKLSTSALVNNADLVFMYPVEFNVYTGSGAPLVSYNLNENGDWIKQYRVLNTQGSNALQIAQEATTKITYSKALEPFGLDYSADERFGWIGKERDKESGLFDMGARKYDPLGGRFLSNDAMWDKFVGSSSYHYCRNNPIRFGDDNWLWIAAQHRALLNEAFKRLEEK